MESTTRRDVIAGLSIGAASAFIGACRTAAAQDAGAGGPAGSGVPSFAPAPGMHQPVALPFDPATLNGLSAALMNSHYTNNYLGALKNLNAVELDIQKITMSSPGYQVAGLKERELTFTNSVILHELYFANLGGNGMAAGSIQQALTTSFGTIARWEELFRATAMSLAGGSGWAILDFDFHTGDPRIYWAGNHTQSVAFGQPLLVMDMYEHSYHIDFGAAAGKYVDAFFMNIKWEEVDRRYQRALLAFKAIYSL